MGNRATSLLLPNWVHLVAGRGLAELIICPAYTCLHCYHATTHLRGPQPTQKASEMGGALQTLVGLGG